jgi:RHS repeat-associated protein
VTAGPVGSHLISGRRLLESEALMRCLWLVLAVLVSLPSAAMAQVVEFYHLDALGSVRAVTNEQGGIVEQRDYLPFGEEWCGASGFCDPAAPGQGQPRRFTAKERDTETGLDYFGARYYGARLARFTTIDPVFTWEENLADPQRWNRFAYGLNNPLRHLDPDGRAASDTSKPAQGSVTGQLPPEKVAEIERSVIFAAIENPIAQVKETLVVGFVNVLAIVPAAIIDVTVGNVIRATLSPANQGILHDSSLPGEIQPAFNELYAHIWHIEGGQSQGPPTAAKVKSAAGPRPTDDVVPTSASETDTVKEGLVGKIESFMGATRSGGREEQ